MVGVVGGLGTCGVGRGGLFGRWDLEPFRPVWSARPGWARCRLVIVDPLSGVGEQIMLPAAVRSHGAMLLGLVTFLLVADIHAWVKGASLPLDHAMCCPFALPGYVWLANA